MQQSAAAAAAGDDDEIHHDHDHIVMPAIIGPERNVPFEDFFLNRPEHDEDEAKRRNLRQDARGDGKAPGEFGRAKEEGESFAHADAFAPASGILEMFPAAGGENHGDHQAQQKQAKVGEAGKLREKQGALPSGEQRRK